MDAACIDQMGSLLFVKALKVRNVLEVVCVKLAAFDDVVRLHIVLELLDLQRPALGLEDGLGLREDLGVRRGRGAHLHGGGGLGMANQSTGGQHGGQRQQKFFHGKNLGERVIEKADQDPRLSLRRVAQLPKLWKICTMMMSRITVAIMMSVW